MATADGSGRVALYGAGGAPYHHAAIFARAGCAVDFVFPQDIVGGALAGFDLFVMPGGGYRAMIGQIEPLGHDGARALRAYVESGGMYVGCCAGSYDAATVAQSFVALCPPQPDMCLSEATVWNEGGEEWGLSSPGIGVLRAETVAEEHPVMAGMPRVFEIAHYNGPLFEGGIPLARVAGRTERFTPWEEMLGARPNRTLVDDAAAAGVANIVAGAAGDGRVVLFGSHPEFGFTIAMEDEQLPGLMLRNALAWQLEESGAPDRADVELYTDRNPGDEADADPARVADLAARIRERTARIRELGDEPRWLEQAHAMSFFGLSSSEIWSRSLDAIDRLSSEAEHRAPHTEPRALSFRPPDEWNLDGGYHGVVALLEQSLALLDRTLATWDFDPGETTDPYQYLETSPYHLVAGSYLAASGRVASAALLCATYERVPA
jgi:Biotin-protein ligase, N terminal